MLTFEEAREIALPQIQEVYKEGPAMTVAEHGWEDETHFALIIEPVVPEPGNMIVDDVQTLITKRGGILQQVNALDNLGREWAEVGDWPELDEEAGA
jgi:hypothetical protein